MSIFDLFRSKNTFDRFARAVKRIQRILEVMEEEARKEHFEQLKGHFEAVQKLIGSKDALNPDCIIRLFLKEKEKSQTLIISEDKIKLNSLENQIEQFLIHIVRVVQEAIHECSDAIASRQNPKELQTFTQLLQKKVSFLEQVAVEINKREKVIKDLYEKIYNQRSSQVTGEAIHFSDRMSNGFTGNNIQKVIRQLRGYIVASSGRHPYKIIFPGKGQIGFSFTMNPLGFLKEIAHLTGVDQKKLELSFREGELKL